MAMSRIFQTLAPRRSAVLTFSPRFFSAGSDVDMGEYTVYVKLPEEIRWSGSKEEKDDWFHWFLSTSCSGPNAAAAAAAAPMSNCRDPRILYTNPNCFFARLSLQDLEALLQRDEFICAEPGGEIDLTFGTLPFDKFAHFSIPYDEAFKAEQKLGAK